MNVYFLPTLVTMTDVVPIATLRQNPAPALKAVSEGQSLVVTSHNRPVADLVPHRRRHGVSPAAFAEALLRTRVDAGWGAELADGRTEDADDPWTGR